MRKLIVLFYIIFSSLTMWSQTSASTGEWEVLSFSKTKEFKAAFDQVLDYENNPCAVIMFNIPAKDVEISGDDVKQTEKIDGCWYVYVVDGALEIDVNVDGVRQTYELTKLNKKVPKIEGLVTYELTLRKAEPHRKSANLKALAMSIVPGIGLIQKGHSGEGIGYLLGDVALIGAGIGFNIYGNNQKKVMNDPNTTFGQYKKAKNNYDSARTGSYICYGAAAGVYLLNLVRSFVARPNPGAPLQWVFSTSTVPEAVLTRGTNLTFNVSLCYTF